MTARKIRNSRPLSLEIAHFLSLEELSKIDVTGCDIILHEGGDTFMGPIKEVSINSGTGVVLFICSWIAKFDRKTNVWRYCRKGRICGVRAEPQSFVLGEDDHIEVRLSNIGTAFIILRGDHLKRKDVKKPQKQNLNRAI